ncbi:MAG: hypothetical protein E7Z92_02190 [Cyanobacteria bacterium SIG31]|nr:hypothetical protein [Cyanobacteria bacterium SIG31]
MIYNVNFSGRETLLTTAAKEAKKIKESPQHKYLSDRMSEGAEEVVKKAEEKLAAELNAAYQAANAPFIHKPKTRVEELKEFTKPYIEAHGG